MTMAPVNNKGPADARVLRYTWDDDGVWGSCCYLRHIDLSALCFYQAPWCHLGLSHSIAPCLGPCLSIAGAYVDVHGLCFHQRPQECPGYGFPPVAIVSFKGCVTEGLWWSGWSTHQGNGVILARVIGTCHVYVHGSTAARDFSSISDSCCHRRLWRCLRSELTPEAMLVPEGQSIARAVEIGVACIPFGAIMIFGIKLWPGTMSVSTAVLQPRSVFMLCSCYHWKLYSC